MEGFINFKVFRNNNMNLKVKNKSDLIELNKKDFWGCFYELL